MMYLSVKINIVGKNAEQDDEHTEYGKFDAPQTKEQRGYEQNKPRNKHFAGMLRPQSANGTRYEPPHRLVAMARNWFGIIVYQ